MKEGSLGLLAAVQEQAQALNADDFLDRLIRVKISGRCKVEDFKASDLSYETVGFNTIQQVLKKDSYLTIPDGLVREFSLNTGVYRLLKAPEGKQIDKMLIYQFKHSAVKFDVNQAEAVIVIRPFFGRVVSQKGLLGAIGLTGAGDNGLVDYLEYDQKGELKKGLIGLSQKESRRIKSNQVLSAKKAVKSFLMPCELVNKTKTAGFVKFNINEQGLYQANGGRIEGIGLIDVPRYLQRFHLNTQA